MCNLCDDPTQEDIDESMEFADTLADEISTSIAEADVEPSGVWFSLFILSIHILAAWGWTEEDLVQEVRTHVRLEDEPTAGNA
jgi:hypothetical protein